MTIKGFRILVSAVAVYLFASASASAVAQPMPVDSLIIKGTLDNGMTYYISITLILKVMRTSI